MAAVTWVYPWWKTTPSFPPSLTLSYNSLSPALSFSVILFVCLYPSHYLCLPSVHYVSLSSCSLSLFIPPLFESASLLFCHPPLKGNCTRWFSLIFSACSSRNAGGHDRSQMGVGLGVCFDVGFSWVCPCHHQDTPICQNLVCSCPPHIQQGFPDPGAEYTGFSLLILTDNIQFNNTNRQYKSNLCLVTF